MPTPSFAVDGRRAEVSNPPMVAYLPAARQAFRARLGLPPGSEPVSAPDAPDHVFAWARRHRLTGLMATFSPATDAALQTAAYGQAQHAARFTHEAERLFALLSPRLPALALVKGPALAAQAWPQPGLRSFDDLDFLCARRDYPQLLAGLQAAGYAPDTDDPRRMEHLWHYGWGVAFRHPDGFLVEANHRFFPPHYPWPRRIRATGTTGFAPQPLDAAAVRAPTPALHLLLGCEHTIWHGWARLAWIADVAGLLARYPDVFGQAMALAQGCPFAERALTIGCAVADALFGPGLSPVGRMYPDVVAHATARLGGQARGMNAGELRKLHERFMTRSEILAYRLRRTFTPGDGDFQRLSLPSAWRGLYWLLRPARGVRFGP